MVNTAYDEKVYDALIGEPKAVFKKTIRGRVTVQILDPLDPSGKTKIYHVMEGEPDSAGSFVKLYTDEQVKFFYLANRRLIDKGLIVPVSDYNIISEDEIKVYTDEDIEAALKDRYFKKFQKFIDEYVDSSSRMARVIEIARKLDLSKSKLDYLKAKAIELGLGEDVL